MEVQLRREKRNRGEFEVVFELHRGEQEVLTLQLLCQQSLSFYSLVIDSQYLKNNSDMITFFPTPSALLYTLGQLFEQLQLSPEGIITLTLSLSAAKVNLSKVYSLRMNPWAEGELEYLRSKLSQQQQAETLRIAEKESQILQLQATVQGKEESIAELKNELKTVKTVIESLEQRISDLEASLEEAHTQLSLSEHQNTIASTQIEELKRKLEERDQMIHKRTAEEKSLTAFQEKMQTAVYEFNPQIYHFHYAYSPNALRVAKKSENGWSNFASAYPLPIGTSSFTIRLLKMRDGSLAIGVGSEGVLSCSSLEHAEFVGYLCRDGRIYENGMRRINGTPILPQQSVTMTITRGAQGSVSWQVGGNEIGTAVLPSSTNGKRLFLVVKVFWKQDEFELLL